MSTRGEDPIPILLGRLASGDPDAAEALFPLVYEELRDIAQGQFRRERADHTLQATALVHEAYLRLLGGVSGSMQDRAHFLAIAARVMRQVLVDHARRRNAKKRSAPIELVTMERIPALDGSTPIDVIELDGALERLQALDPRKARVIELRLFADMSMDEIAEALCVSKRTVEGDWFFARAWLQGELK